VWVDTPQRRRKGYVYSGQYGLRHEWLQCLRCSSCPSHSLLNSRTCPQSFIRKGGECWCPPGFGLVAGPKGAGGVAADRNCVREGCAKVVHVAYTNPLPRHSLYNRPLLCLHTVPSTL
jgi:hypothetical protein